MASLARSLILVGVLLFAELAVFRHLAAQQPSREPRGGLPPWTALEGIRLRDPVDEVVAQGGMCWSAVSMTAEFQPEALIQYAFGDALPHRHDRRDAARTALDDATACRIRMLDERALGVVLAFSRRIAVITLRFDRPDRALSPDSLRALLRSLWGSGNGPASLETWGWEPFRAHLLVPWQRPGWPAEPPRVIILDVPACTRFERRVHQTPGTGTASAC